MTKHQTKKPRRNTPTGLPWSLCRGRRQIDGKRLVPAVRAERQDDFLAEELEAAIRILQRLQHRLQLTHMISDPASLAFGLASEVIMEEAQKAGE